MSGGWEPSRAYKDYVARTRKESRPFAPCDRYQQIPAGCAICAHSIEEPPCPGLVKAFVSQTGAYPIEGTDGT